MDNILPDEVNRKIREANLIFKKQRDDLKQNIDFFNTGNCIDVFFRSEGCVYDRLGCCYICDYGICKETSSDNKIFSDFVNGIEKYLDMTTILLSTNGSILDKNNISAELLAKILIYISNSKFDKIIFETHVTTINAETITNIKNILNDKSIYFELGLETVDDLYRKECLGKNVTLYQFMETIKLIYDLSCHTTINILYGLPFLSPGEQFREAKRTIDWTLENTQNDFVLFPINIKPYTLLGYMHKKGIYDIVSHWGYIELLNQIDVNNLDRVILAYHGDREDEYSSNLHDIHPQCCDSCNKQINTFYSKFKSKYDSQFRRKVINEIISFGNASCMCRKSVLKEINSQKKFKIEEIKKSLIKMLVEDGVLN